MALIRLTSIALAGAVLSACATIPEVTAPASSSPTQRQPAPFTVAPWYTEPSPEQQRLIADLLFEGLQALDADRLLTPIESSAHARFKRVLAYEPDNEIALQGLEDIVLRYLELAREAGLQGLFEQADEFIDRARFVDDTHDAIAETVALVDRERNSGDLFFNLDSQDVASRGSAVRQRLGDIARQAREHEAFFLITAPTDEHARWMYSVMRDAVDGYRLRGNIELASRFSIRLRLPEQSSL